MANFTNGAYSTLASGITAVATSLTLASGEGSRFPSADFYLCVYDSVYPNWAVAFRNGAGEVMLVGARSSDTCSSITRGVGGSTAIAFNTSGKTYKAELNYVAENFADTSNSLTDVWYVDSAYATSDTNARKVKTIGEAIGANRHIIVAEGTYNESVNISNINNVKLVGLGRTRWNGTTLVGGVIITNTSSTLIIQNNCNGITIENVGVINTSTNNGVSCTGYTGVTIRDITLRDVTVVLPESSGHGILFEEAGGTMSNIFVENCQSYNGNHGIIIKAKDVTVIGCYVQNAQIYSYAALSDNVVAATRLSQSKNVSFKKCIAKRTSTLSGSRGFEVYGVDFSSETNSNGILAVNNVVFEDCYAEGCQQGFSIARSSGAFVFPKINTGQSQVAPISIKLIGCKAYDNDDEGICLYYGTDVVCVATSAISNGTYGFFAGNATTPRAIGCYSISNVDNSYTSFSTGNI